MKVKPKLITFSNNFHKTEVTIKVKEVGWNTLSEGQTKKLIKQLCPHEQCHCGGICGPRNPHFVLDMDKRIRVFAEEG